MRFSGPRLASLDALRGLAVVLMFLHHFPLFLMRDYQISEAFSVLFASSRFAAPLFLFLVGVSMVLSAEKRVKQTGEDAAAKHLATRGLVLLAAGSLLNALIFQPLGYLNILHTIGLSIILLIPVAIKPTPKKLFSSLLLLTLMSIILPTIQQTKEILDLFSFPLLPWTAFAVFGAVFGYYINVYESRGEARRIPRLFEYSALASMLCAFFLTAAGQGFDFDSYATASFIALSMGLLLYLSSLAFWLYEVYGKRPMILKPLVVYGRNAFPVYFIHQIFIATIPGLFGALNTFSLAESMAALMALFFLGYLVLDRMGR